MNDKPLTNSGRKKLLIFTLLMTLSVIANGIGIVPSFILIFGIFMMMKNQNFNYLCLARKYCKIYFLLVSIVFFALAFFQNGIDGVVRDPLFALLVSSFSLIPVIYIVVVDKLFFRVLDNHQEWIMKNGFFHDVSRNKSRENNSKQYSIANELLKLNQLNELGVITDDEFKSAKSKLLKS